MRYFLIEFLVFVSLGLYAFNPAVATPTDDFYIQQALDHYFSLPEDSKSVAMAGSNSPTCDEGSCIFQNPAGLAFVKSPEISASIGTGKRTGDDFLRHEGVEQFQRAGFGVFAFPTSEENQTNDWHTAIALSFSRYKGEINDRIASSPDGHRRSLGAAIGTEEFSAGYSLTFYDDQLRSQLSDLHSHARFLHIFGLQGAFGEGFRVGAVFRLGIGQSDTEDFISKANGLSHLRENSGVIGVSQHFGLSSISASLDYAYVRTQGNLDDVVPGIVVGGNESGDVFGARVGGELRMFDLVALRGGFRWYEVGRYEFERESLSDLSGRVQGFGASGGLSYFLDPDLSDSRKPRLEIASEYFTPGHGGWQHVVGLYWPFG